MPIATKNEADHAKKMREKLFHLVGIKKDDVIRLSGNKEKTLILFNIDSMEKVYECLPKLDQAAKYLLNKARQI